MTRREKTACMGTFHRMTTTSMRHRTRRIPIPNNLHRRHLLLHQRITHLLPIYQHRLRNVVLPFPVVMSLFTLTTTIPLPTTLQRPHPSRSANTRTLRTPIRVRPRAHRSRRTEMTANTTHVLHQQIRTICLSASSDHVISDKPPRWAIHFPSLTNLQRDHPQNLQLPLPSRNLPS